jgi:hypothetical protein
MIRSEYWAGVRTYALLAIVFRLYTDAWREVPWGDFAAGGIVAAVAAYPLIAAWAERRNQSMRS